MWLGVVTKLVCTSVQAEALSSPYIRLSMFSPVRHSNAVEETGGVNRVPTQRRSATRCRRRYRLEKQLQSRCGVGPTRVTKVKPTTITANQRNFLLAVIRFSVRHTRRRLTPAPIINLP